MNKLGIDIKENEIVVDNQGNLYQVFGGNGMSASGMGGMIMARALDGTTIDLRYEINRFANQDETESFPSLARVATFKRLTQELAQAEMNLKKAKEALIDFQVEEV